MHMAAMNPIAIDKDSVPAETVEHEKHMIKEEIKNDEKNKNKPEEIIDKMAIGKLNKLADKLLPEIYTNIDSNEILSMFPQLMKYYVAESKGWPYETKGKTINKTWYGIPITLEENVKKLHEEVYHQTNYTVSNKVKEISNSIIEKTGYK